MPRGDIWLGDAARAVSALSPGGAPDAALVDAIARLLGLDAMAAGGGRASTAALQAKVDAAHKAAVQDAPVDEPPAPATSVAELPPTGQDHRLPSHLQPLSVAPSIAPPGWADQLALQPLPAAPLARPSLLPRQRRRALLTTWLSETAEDGEPDLPRIVAQLAQGRPLLRLPRRPRRTLRHGVELRIDRAPWLAPFHADQAELAAYLGQLLPRDSLRLVVIDGGPVPAVPPRRRALRQKSAASAQAPMLLLSDMGAGYLAQAQMPAPPAAWRALADTNRRLGRRTLALSPWAQPPGAGLAMIESLVWDERLRLADVARVRAGQQPQQRHRFGDGDNGDGGDGGDGGARALARWVSPALCVTPWLLRQARAERLPELGPQAEAALWFSDIVQSAGNDGLVLDPEVARALSAELNDVELEAALALLARARPAIGDVTAIEEALLALELRGELNEDSVAALLMPALKALAAAPAASDTPDTRAQPHEVANWAAHAWTRFSPALRATRTARQLAFGAARHLSTRAWLAAEGGVPPALPAGSDWLFSAVAGNTRQLSVELRAYADGSTNLVIGPPQPATSALHRIDVPAEGPVWIEVSEHRSDGSEPAIQTVAVRATEFTQVDVKTLTASAALELQVLAGLRWRVTWPATTAQTLRDSVWHAGRQHMAALIISDHRAVVPLLNSKADASFDEPLGGPDGVFLSPTHVDEPSGVYVHAKIIGKLTVQDGDGSAEAWVLERQGDVSPHPRWRVLDPQIRMPFDADPGRSLFAPLALVEAFHSIFLASNDQELYDTEQVRIENVMDTDPALLLDESGWRVITALDTVPQSRMGVRYRLRGVRWTLLQQQALDWRPSAANPSEAASSKPDGAVDSLDPTGVEVAVPRSFGTSLRARFAQVIERREDADVGLFRIALPPNQGMQLQPAAWPGGSRPVLLFIHGEMTDTEANFADLLREGSDQRHHLSERYGERIFAWRWRSVTRGLVRNAVELAQALASGGEVHICSFSAGGLLAELLCFVNRHQGADMHGAAWERWRAAPDYHPGDAKGVDALAQTLNNNKLLHIGRFVRVACPAAGTALYGSGVDRTLGLMKLVPYIGAGLSLLPGMSTLFGDAQASPGLAMLAPGAGVQPLLTVAARTDAPLTVVAGVAQSTGLWRSIGTGLLNWAQKGSDHDLVVPLASTFGGLERSGGVDYLVVKGPEVNHFNFFANVRTRQAVVDALLQTGTPAGFAHAETLAELQQLHDPASSGAKASATNAQAPAA